MLKYRGTTGHTFSSHLRTPQASKAHQSSRSYTTPWQRPVTARPPLPKQARQTENSLNPIKKPSGMQVIDWRNKIECRHRKKKHTHPNKSAIASQQTPLTELQEYYSLRKDPLPRSWRAARSFLFFPSASRPSSTIPSTLRVGAIAAERHRCRRRKRLLGNPGTGNQGPAGRFFLGLPADFVGNRARDVQPAGAAQVLAELGVQLVQAL